MPTPIDNFNPRVESWCGGKSVAETSRVKSIPLAGGLIFWSLVVLHDPIGAPANSLRSIRVQSRSTAVSLHALRQLPRDEFKLVVYTQDVRDYDSSLHGCIDASSASSTLALRLQDVEDFLQQGPRVTLCQQGERLCQDQCRDGRGARPIARLTYSFSSLTDSRITSPNLVRIQFWTPGRVCCLHRANTRILTASYLRHTSKKDFPARAPINTCVPMPLSGRAPTSIRQLGYVHTNEVIPASTQALLGHFSLH